jgi:hypothetical protein
MRPLGEELLIVSLGPHEGRNTAPATRLSSTSAAHGAARMPGCAGAQRFHDALQPACAPLPPRRSI